MRTSYVFAVFALLALGTWLATSVAQVDPPQKMAPVADATGPNLALRVAALEARVAALEHRLVGERQSESRITVNSTQEVLSLDNIRQLIGSTEAIVIADDGTFLGDLSQSLSRKSIANDIGPHGSNISPKSMFNDIGVYGNSISPRSARCELSQDPPRLFFKGRFVCYVTVNKMKSPRIHPDVLRAAVDEG